MDNGTYTAAEIDEKLELLKNDMMSNINKAIIMDKITPTSPSTQMFLQIENVVEKK